MPIDYTIKAAAAHLDHSPGKSTAVWIFRPYYIIMITSWNLKEGSYG